MFFPRKKRLILYIICISYNLSILNIVHTIEKLFKIRVHSSVGMERVSKGTDSWNEFLFKEWWLELLSLKFRKINKLFFLRNVNGNYRSLKFLEICFSVVFFVMNKKLFLFRFTLIFNNGTTPHTSTRISYGI